MPNRPLATAYTEIMTSMGAPQLCDIERDPMPGSYSTDQGNVTQVCPGIHPVYIIPAKDGASNHTHEFTAAAATDEAHKLTIDTAKGMAGAAWRVLVDDEFAKAVWEDFQMEIKTKQ